jgi:hypothetical protein
MQVAGEIIRELKRHRRLLDKAIAALQGNEGRRVRRRKKRTEMPAEQLWPEAAGPAVESSSKTLAPILSFPAARRASGTDGRR